MLKKIVLLLLIGATSLLLGAKKEPGSDHPMLSRYSGSVMTGYWTSKFDEGIVPLGKRKNDQSFEKKVDFEGKITAIIYEYPKDRSTLEIMRNYKQALQSQGFTIVWECKNKDCGGAYGGSQLSNAGSLDGKYNPWIGHPSDSRLLTAKLTKNGQDAYVNIFTWGYHHSTTVHIFEPEAMETGMVTSDSLAKEMAETGKAVLHINFDSGKAVILSESYATLDQVAELMQTHSGMRVSIEGHTDSQGDESANQSLSERRANAVKQALVNKGITASRMETKGLGENVPVADNGTEAGRAQNRRVEIVNLTPDALGAKGSQEVAGQAQESDSEDSGLWSRLSEAVSQSEPEESNSRIEKKLDQKQEQVTDKIIDKSVDTAVDSLIKSLF